MFRDQLGEETLELMRRYKDRFGHDVPTMYLPAQDERELQDIIAHALRTQVPLPVRTH